MPHPTRRPLAPGLLALGSLALVVPAARAQTAHATPTTPAVAPADSLAAFAGAWDVVIGGTPLGDVTGRLVVGADSTTLALPDLGVLGAAVGGVRVEGGALTGVTTFYANPPGQTFTCTLTLRPADGGAVTGTVAVEGDQTYPLSGRRPAR